MHPHLFGGDQCAGHEIVDRRQDGFDVPGFVDAFDDDREVLGEAQDRPGVYPAGTAEACDENVLIGRYKGPAITAVQPFWSGG